MINQVIAAAFFVAGLFLLSKGSVEGVTVMVAACILGKMK